MTINVLFRSVDVDVARTEAVTPVVTELARPAGAA
jgi:hypothetical protein